jgi:phosphatidylserine decarboxylase
VPADRRRVHSEEGPPKVLRNFLAPIHQDGWKFIAAFAVLTVILFLIWEPLGWLGVLATAWCAYFFRDPWRVTPTRPGLVVSPADGLVVSVGPAVPPAELGLPAEPMTRVGIFLNVLDVHVNRMPVSGRVVKLSYRPGKFVNASLDKASEDNERMAIRMATDDGPEIACVQIAGLVARRIVCNLREGEKVVAGQRFGLMRFGSRTDIYLPMNWSLQVILGQRTIGGETVLADARSDEAPRRGILH